MFCYQIGSYGHYYHLRSYLDDQTEPVEDDEPLMLVPPKVRLPLVSITIVGDVVASSFALRQVIVH